MWTCSLFPIQQPLCRLLWNEQFIETETLSIVIEFGNFMPVQVIIWLIPAVLLACAPKRAYHNKKRNNYFVYLDIFFCQDKGEALWVLWCVKTVICYWGENKLKITHLLRMSWKKITNSSMSPIKHGVTGLKACLRDSPVCLQWETKFYFDRVDEDKLLLLGEALQGRETAGGKMWISGGPALVGRSDSLLHFFK